MFEQLQKLSPFKQRSSKEDTTATSLSQAEPQSSTPRQSLSSGPESPMGRTEAATAAAEMGNSLRSTSPVVSPSGESSHRFEDVQQGFLNDPQTTDGRECPSTPKMLFASATKDSSSNLQQPSIHSSSDSSTEGLTNMMDTAAATVTPSPPTQPPLPFARYHRSSRRKSRSHRRGSSTNRKDTSSSSLSHSLLLDGYDEGGSYNHNHGPVAVRRRPSQRDFRRTSSTSEMPQPLLPRRGAMSSCSSDGCHEHYRQGSSVSDFMTSSPDFSSESSPDSSPNRGMVSGMQPPPPPPHRHCSYDFTKDKRLFRQQASFSSSSRISGSMSDPSHAAGLASSASFGGSSSRSSFKSNLNGNKKWISRYWCLAGTFFGMVMVSLLGMIHLTNRASHDASYDMEFHMMDRPDMFSSAAGLRGKMVQGRWDDGPQVPPAKSKPKTKPPVKDTKGKKKTKQSLEEKKDAKHEKTATKPPVKTTKKSSAPTSSKPVIPARLKMKLPPPMTLSDPKFDAMDPNLYWAKGGGSSSNNKSKSSSFANEHTSEHPRIVLLDPSVSKVARKIQIYPADFTDNTQLYGILPSDDERLSRMEIRAPYSEGECVPMQDWQTTFHPSCNGMHELALETLGASAGDHDPLDGVMNAGSAKGDDYVNLLGGVDAELFGTKGFWRYAWKVTLSHYDDDPEPEKESVVLKTLKFEHNFEDAHFEHDRVDAVAMERLTASPHVINIFGFCGHSVVTEYADGSRVGELADKAKKNPLERLRIARDIAHGLADVHGIDGDGNATFVHLDVNPANVVSIGGTLKLNDFNIGIIRRWNTTSNEPCGFPAQYPNPQWRSPEEARDEQDLTEKVDIFSMGHIFFRLICGHEPWNKLEPGGRPSKEEINRKVQNGETPFIPDDIRESENPEVIAIRDAMLACYKPNPKDRPSAREIAKTLDETLASLSSSTSQA